MIAICFAGGYSAGKIPLAREYYFRRNKETSIQKMRLEKWIDNSE